MTRIRKLNPEVLSILGFPWWLIRKRIRLLVVEMQVQSLGREDPLEEEMASHSSILVWEISRIEEPGELQSTGSHKS